MAALAAASVLTVAACSAGQPASSPEHIDAQAKGLRLYVFDCGTLKADLARFRLSREEVAASDLSVPCFLVVHPQGRLIWDAGAVPDADWTPTGSEVAHHLVLPDSGERDLTLRKPLMAQLAEAGYSPSDITHLALSHYHYDHTANANAFASATWLVRQVERDAMFAAKPPGVTRPSSYAALKNSKTVIIEKRTLRHPGERPVVRRFWPGVAEREGIVIPKGRGWVFSYEPGESDDEALFHLENHPIKLGQYLTITEPDGEKLPFKVVSCHD